MTSNLHDEKISSQNEIERENVGGQVRACRIGVSSPSRKRNSRQSRRLEPNRVRASEDIGNAEQHVDGGLMETLKLRLGLRAAS